MSAGICEEGQSGDLPTWVGPGLGAQGEQSLGKEGTWRGLG